MAMLLSSLEESQLIAVRPEFWRPTSRSMMSAVAAGVSRPLRAPGVVRTGAGGELFWSRWAGWRGRVDRAGAAGAGFTQLKKMARTLRVRRRLEVALVAGRPRASGQVNRRGGLTLGWCARCLSSGFAVFSSLAS